MDRKNKLLIITMVVILAVLAVAMIMVFSYDSSQSNRNSSSSLTSKSDVNNGLQLSITVHAINSQYKSGEAVPITFTITNSKQSINFFNTYVSSNLNFQVYNSSHSKIYSWLLGAYPPTNETIALGPRESYSKTLDWSQDSNMGTLSHQVPAGTYYIVGEIGENIPYQLQTSQLKLTITQ